jgi:hypothetical protein
MKTLDDAVIELNGIWPEGAEVLLTTGDEWCGDVEFSGRIIAGYKPYNDYGYAFMDQSIQGYAIIGSNSWIVLCRMNEFQQCAKELGIINGYRWGVEYKTNGKRPDLPDDVVVAIKNKSWIETSHPVCVWYWAKYISSFKITDPRYKPADTSYLEKPTITGIDLADGKDRSVEHIHNPDNGSDWWNYDDGHAKTEMPVGTICLYLGSTGEPVKTKVLAHHPDLNKDSIWHQAVSGVFAAGCHYSVDSLMYFKPLDHDRKSKAERKRMIEEIYEIDPLCLDMDVIERLYDLGCLQLPKDVTK